MMKIKLAWKAFIKAFKEPEKAQKFIDDETELKFDESKDQTHLRLLGYLQQGGRLIDFLKEDIHLFSDAQVGAAVRRIHQECGQTLEDLVAIRPLREEKEGAIIQVPRGYNPAEIKIVGAVKGEGPFSGILVHKGWKAYKKCLPKKNVELNLELICPAEIEVKM